MSIDARLLKEMIQLQLLRKFDSISSKDTSKDGTDDLNFASQLNQIMSQVFNNPDLTNNNAATDNSLLANMGKLNNLAPYYSNQPSNFDPLIAQSSRLYGVNSDLIKSVIYNESSYNPYAVSKTGAKGLMQLMDDTSQGLGVTDPFDPKQNIEGGTQFLSYLLHKYNGNVGTAVAAYNAGPGRIDQLGIHDDAELYARYDQLPKETQGYVKHVLDTMNSYQN